MNETSTKLNFICWMIAAIATGGSLFFSEVMEFPPCVLCWYQRIAMDPLVAIFLVGSFRGARESYAFALPLVVIGWLTAVYHNLLHYEIVPESASPCREGVSCATVYIDWLGFITIPMLSLFAFTLIGAILIYMKRTQFNEQ